MTSPFLIFGLILPRATLAVCWLAGCIPANTSPLEADIAAFVLCPRLLIAVWAYQAEEPVWAAVYLAVWAWMALGTAGRARSHGVSSSQG
jgi:hypothetical protein